MHKQTSVTDMVNQIKQDESLKPLYPTSYDKMHKTQQQIQNERKMNYVNVIQSLNANVNSSPKITSMMSTGQNIRSSKKQVNMPSSLNKRSSNRSHLHSIQSSPIQSSGDRNKEENGQDVEQPIGLGSFALADDFKKGLKDENVAVFNNTH